MAVGSKFEMTSNAIASTSMLMSGVLFQMGASYKDILLVVAISADTKSLSD